MLWKFFCQKVGFWSHQNEYYQNNPVHNLQRKIQTRYMVQAFGKFFGLSHFDSIFQCNQDCIYTLHRHNCLENLTILDFLYFKSPKQTYSCRLVSRQSFCWCLVEEMLMYNSQHTVKFEFSFPFTLCLTFQELSFSVFESLGVS